MKIVLTQVVFTLSNTYSLKSSLEAIANEITWEDVPGTTIESCGNYKDHSLHSAKEWAKLILEQGISDQAFERHTV